MKNPLPKTQQVSVEMIRAEFSYDPETGVVTRRSTGNTGRKNRRGYIQMNAFKTMFLAHRIAFAIANGRWPSALIDHVNGIPDDNRISNLREATSAENSHNRAARKNSATGISGVYWIGEVGKYSVKIRLNYKLISIGYYRTIEEATAARIAAELKYHGKFAAHLNRTLPLGLTEAGSSGESGEGKGIQ